MELGLKYATLMEQSLQKTRHEKKIFSKPNLCFLKSKCIFQHTGEGLIMAVTTPKKCDAPTFVRVL